MMKFMKGTKDKVKKSKTNNYTNLSNFCALILLINSNYYNFHGPLTSILS
jgi:hypothetical protein